jgi:uncharacterized protein YjiS (DUF1127 family)
MSQMQTFSLATAGRLPASQARRARTVLPGTSLSGVSLRMVLSRIEAWRQRRAERQALAALLSASDHLLDDVGIGRPELHAMLDRL